jgi:transcriptional regulator with XRE-family HTH domain
MPVGSMTATAHHDFGAALRLARERSGRSLRQMADTTKLSVRAFDALERNRIDQLPGGIYRRAIVRAYASEVGLDVEQTLRAFLELHPDEVPTAVQVPAGPMPKRGALRGLFGMLGALVPVAAGAFYFMHAGRQPAAPPSPDRTLAASSEVLSIGDASLAAYEQSPVMMMLSISSRAYLEIAAGGREVIAREVGPGETVRVELSTDVTLTGSDASAVHFSINGRAGRSLGAAGEPLAVRIDRDTYEDWLIKP